MTELCFQIFLFYKNFVLIMIKSLWSIGVILLIFLSGCSNHVPLRGTVTFSDDGSPLPSGSVIFETDSFSAVGPIQPDGTYRLGSLKENDGIPPGTYQVYVQGVVQANLSLGGAGAPVAELLVDPKFTSPKTSGLVFEVTSKNRQFDFSVDRIGSARTR